MEFVITNSIFSVPTVANESKFRKLDTWEPASKANEDIVFEINKRPRMRELPRKDGIIFWRSTEYY